MIEKELKIKKASFLFSYFVSQTNHIFQIGLLLHIPTLQSDQQNQDKYIFIPFDAIIITSVKGIIAFVQPKLTFLLIFTQIFAYVFS